MPEKSSKTGLSNLISQLKEKEILRSEGLIEALKKVDRADFVRLENRDLAYLDEALPIGFNQTISQPYTVVFMLELLSVKKGNIVMDAGYGSGWQTGLLAYLVGKRGLVYGFEIMPELCLLGRENLKNYPDLLSRTRLYCQNAKNGVEGLVPGKLDRIIAAAELTEIPQAWRKQLMVGGIMVYPRRGSLFREIKKSRFEFSKEEFPGFAFVPFVD